MQHKHLLPEPQIGIEPMTARPDVPASSPSPSGNESNRPALGAQGTPEAAPNSEESGNQVATSDEAAGDGWSLSRESGYHIILGVLASRRRRMMQARRTRRAA
jgi:hypothetical protein